MTAVTITKESNANLQATTREAWRDSIQRQVFMKHPMLARLMMANRITWNGGGRILVPLDIAEGDDMAQFYTPTDPLDAESKTYLTLAEFDWKSLQIPIMYGLRERLNNVGPARQFDLREILVDKAHRAMQITLSNVIYGVNSSDTRAADGGLTASQFDDTGGTVGTSGCVAGDGEVEFQSAAQAVTIDATYGKITRTAATTPSVADYWQPALMTVNTSWDAAAKISPTFINEMTDACMEHADKYTAGDFLIVMGPSLYRSLRRYVQSHRIDTGTGPLAKWGFSSFTMNGFEVAMDYRLQHKHINGVGVDNTLSSEKWVFCFCIPTFELRFHAERKLQFTGFKWQGDRPGGRDEWLARIMASGNFFCVQPNVNMWRPNVT